MLSVAYLDVSTLDIEAAKKYVSHQRLIKAEKLKNIDAKKECLGAELLLTSLFGAQIPDAMLPPKLSLTNSGKPYFTDYPHLFLSLSHSNLYAACAISDSPVGIDLQYMRSFNERLVERFFTVNEQKFFEASTDKTKAFYEIWTKKEAYLKCIGTGLCNISSASVFDLEKQGFDFKINFFDNFAMCICKKISTEF